MGIKFHLATIKQNYETLAVKYCTDVMRFSHLHKQEGLY